VVGCQLTNMATHSHMPIAQPTCYTSHFLQEGIAPGTFHKKSCLKKFNFVPAGPRSKALKSKGDRSSNLGLIHNFSAGLV
jgi:hypothetical protein